MPAVPTLMLGASASGQGKTSVTAALAGYWRARGKRVRVFKTGPDFIDPHWLHAASGQPVDNLDLWLLGEEACRRALAEAAQDADLLLIEAVMGLYDGHPSSADLARALDIPVALVMDASAMAQTVGALAAGLRDYGALEVVGVLANRVAAAGHLDLLRQGLRTIPLLGHLPPQAQALPERHLGLVLPEEEPAQTLLTALSDALVLDVERWDALPVRQWHAPAPAPMPRLLQGRHLAVARDAACAFLYPANLNCLRQLGAYLHFFSPLADQPIPQEADALYLPGGYPELHAVALSGAQRWKKSLADHVAAGRPVWAECGGMMLLADTLHSQDGQTQRMAGILPGAIRMQPRLAGLGAQSWVVSESWPALRGHSFHYSVFDTALLPCAYSQALHGHAREAVYCSGSVRASYFHPYFSSSPRAAAHLFLPEEAPCAA